MIRLKFAELGLSTAESGENVLHIRFNGGTVPCGSFVKNLVTGAWFFSGTGWTQYNSEWLDAIADKLDELNATTMQ
jgi:hypothetical protein